MTSGANIEPDGVNKFMGTAPHDCLVFRLPPVAVLPTMQSGPRLAHGVDHAILGENGESGSCSGFSQAEAMRGAPKRWTISESRKRDQIEFDTRTRTGTERTDEVSMGNHDTVKELGSLVQQAQLRAGITYPFVHECSGEVSPR